jgi:hypothetical protein
MGKIALAAREGGEMVEILEVPGDDDELALNVLRANTTPDESAIGWADYERRGHTPGREYARRSGERAIEAQPGMVENLLAAIEIVSNGLIGTTIVLAVIVVLACVASFLRSFVSSY